METLWARGQLALVISPLTDGAVVVWNTVTPVGVILHQAEGLVQAGAGLALSDLLLAVTACPGQRADAVEISQHVDAVTLVEAGRRVCLALVNINLTELPRPARLAETTETVSDAVETLPAILTANTSGLLRHCHVADLPQATVQYRGYG